ncbi:copper resistance system multicopper oxidase [Candidatus Nitrospira neomarina]|uniref:Copper resistance system multicopper oxidase n=1 Tax=Candidatus Nitrospira neomarina TaxID=3020899 RepID=A0AA96GJK8_9BACT|nr:copper resistance system multicopper oxidase [Candidatus Nitrospira neomarina]WNM63639.1 copper resistance system multicopper oxidase [Candidatus Nitrospira neomarina]
MSNNKDRHDARMTRRSLLKGVGALGIMTAVGRLLPSYVLAGTTMAKAGSPSDLQGKTIDLRIAESPFQIGELTGIAKTINGTLPGPLIRLKEGDNVTLNVTNRLMEDTSIHWHGLLLPPDMDGVPGVSFAGIKPASTFSYRYPIRQSGTYWYHSHSGFQEQSGVYGPLIIVPIEPEPFHYDREYVVVLSDWTFESPESVFANLKKQSDYYNFQKRAAPEFFSDVSRMGLGPALQNYLMWDRMRMDPTDFADVTGYTYTYLMNGLAPDQNWTGLFKPGERVRLRFIAATAMTFYDVRLSGLTMTVVQADGQNVQPVAVDEFRIGPAETYDVIVQPTEERAYTIFAETMDRSGYARGTLAPRIGMTAPLPNRRPRPLRTMAAMGMGMHMNGMDMTDMNKHDQHGILHSEHSEMDEPRNHATLNNHDSHEMSGHAADASRHSMIPGSTPVKHAPGHHGTGNQSVAEFSRQQLDEPGIGLENTGTRVLVYTDLKSLTPYPDQREPGREIELHLTGHMERYMWSFDGKKYSEAKEPIFFRHGERLRLTFVNDTMMEHPLHLHGMWMQLENGAGAFLPRKHTVIVKPAERVSVAITADAPGRWAFHCHLLFHMEAGMFRVVEVSAEGPTVHS